jgi:MFS family permease
LRRLTPENIVPRIVLLLGGICLVQIANLATIPFVTGPDVAVCLYGIAIGATGAVLSVMLIPMQLTVPNRMRGQAMSIVYCGVNLLGTGLGPFLVGFSNERLFGDGAMLGMSMAIVGATSATIAIVCSHDPTLPSRAKLLRQSPPASLPPARSSVDGWIRLIVLPLTARKLKQIEQGRLRKGR